MAARVNKIRHDDNTRTKIQAERIIREFQRFFFGEREMTRDQIKAGEILLNKTIPNLQSVELSGEVSTSKVIRTPNVIGNTQAWLDQHKGETLQ